jgi:predicted nucleic acid-binding protein
MAWLLDTNVLSELRRPKPNQRVVAFVDGCPLEQLYVSVVPLPSFDLALSLSAYHAARRIE